MAGLLRRMRESMGNAVINTKLDNEFEEKLSRLRIVQSVWAAQTKLSMYRFTQATEEIHLSIAGLAKGQIDIFRDYPEYHAPLSSIQAIMERKEEKFTRSREDVSKPIEEWLDKTEECFKLRIKALKLSKFRCNHYSEKIGKLTQKVLRTPREQERIDRNESKLTKEKAVFDKLSAESDSEVNELLMSHLPLFAKLYAEMYTLQDEFFSDIHRTVQKDIQPVALQFRDFQPKRRPMSSPPTALPKTDKSADLSSTSRPRESKRSSSESDRESHSDSDSGRDSKHRSSARRSKSRKEKSRRETFSSSSESDDDGWGDFTKSRSMKR
eukprot:GILK01002713.1.p1 GENE.GILK01002713.1~~GILK01002713.1.p1  ORF type:complete len:339 (-),score=62.70 GILK01002713.1:186-1160(-)